jgi:long-subunit acyl-CoA synthetase (AMP-forming)
MTIAGETWRGALGASAAPALRDRDGTVTASALVDRVERLANGLSNAAPRPRMIGLCADNGVDWVVIDLAAQAAGIPLVPLPAFFAEAQLRHVVDATGMDALFASTSREARALGFEDAGRAAGVSLPWFRRERASPAVVPAGTRKITFTSGTTGTPKGVCLDERAQWSVARALAESMRELRVERHLCLLPLAVLLENVAGIYAPLVHRAACCVPSLDETGLVGAAGFDARRCLAAIERHDAHSVILLPQMLLALTAACEAGARVPACLRFAAVGGAKVAPALVVRARALGWPVYEGYGLSECASVVALNRPGADRVGSVGRPLPHVRVRVAPGGEIEIAGNRLLGYVGSADARADEWLATGDLGRVDDDGFLHVEGRCRNVLITSYGRNVAPEWPEAELLAGPSIAQAAVFGDAQPQLCAIVVPRAASMPDGAIAAAIAHANERLPDYARIGPWIRADAPFDPSNGLATANGRPRRDALWQRYGARLRRLYAKRGRG